MTLALHYRVIEKINVHGSFSGEKIKGMLSIMRLIVQKTRPDGHL
jgi:hypothetical protein